MNPPEPKIEGRSKRLELFVRQFEKVQFTWGVDDCTQWAVLWAQREMDMNLLLPAYASEHEARKYIEDEGGLVSLWDYHLRENGVYKTYTPALGDVGVIRMRDVEMGCIHLHGGIVAVRAETRIAYVRDIYVLQSWAIPYEG